MKQPFLALLLVSVFIAGCVGSQPPSDASATERGLGGTIWQLAGFGEAAESAPLVDGAPVTVVFSRSSALAKGEEGRLAGSAGCNRYFGTYSARKAQLSLSQMGATRKACSPPVMKLEEAYLAALEATRQWKHESDRLTLLDGAGVPLLRFTAAAQADRSAADTLSGEVFYRPRITLPPDAVVHVRLEDVRRADAPARVLAEQTLSTDGRQVPIPFALAYDAEQIQPQRRYVVRAEIRGPDGAPLWATDTARPVLTQGAPSEDVRVEVIQAPARGDRTTAGLLTGSVWQIDQIQTAGGETLTPAADTAYTIAFQDDGRFNGQVDCNRYGGSYKTRSDGGLTLNHTATTLAACPPPSQAGAFMEVLNAVDGYAVQDDRLRLTSTQGGTLTFARKGAPEMGAMEPQRTGKTFVFDCNDPGGEDFNFTMRAGPGEIAVWLPERFGGRYLVLGQVRAASGAKYEGDGVVVWNKGDEALLEVGGETFTGCTLNPQRAPWEEARRRGVDFRAAGQEPGWHLEIRKGERIRFVYAYGEREAVTPTPEPTTDATAGRTVYHAETETHNLTVTLTDEPCTDAMNGERFPTTVTVELDGETYRGCGRVLH